MRTPAFLSAVLVLAALPAAAQVAPAIAPPKRAEVLASAQQLLAARDATAPAGLKDPFHSPAFLEAVGASGVAAAVTPGGAPAGPGGAPAARPAGPRGSSELIAAIGEALRPSGFIVRGGVPSIAFGQKRVKAGDTLTITFEGAEYTVGITALDRTNFTIRLGNEEYTRPIR